MKMEPNDQVKGDNSSFKRISPFEDMTEKSKTSFQQEIYSEQIDQFSLQSISKLGSIERVEYLTSDSYSSVQFENKNLDCSFCNYKTNSKFNLDCHVRTHTGERPYACQFCPYKSASKSNLNNHTKNHKGIKNFTCPNCSFSTDDRASVSRHVRLHLQ